VIKSNRLIFTIYLLFLCAIGVLLLISDKKSLHLIFNEWHTPILDFIFKYLTYLGDGVLIVLVSMLFLLFNIRIGIAQLTVYLLSGIFVQLQKRIIFSDKLRPSAYFENPDILNYVEGVAVHQNHSFPSGHTASAFAFFGLFIFYTKNKWLKIGFLLLAFGVAYSRIYLHEHFLNDVYFGSLYGLLSAIIGYSFYEKKSWNWLNTKLVKLRVNE
jgi:membrane-associated phospholipid phosphatase